MLFDAIFLLTFEESRLALEQEIRGYGAAEKFAG